MDSRISQGSGTEIVKASPIVRHVKAVVVAVIGAGTPIRDVVFIPPSRGIRTHGSAAQPQVPIEPAWDRFLGRNRPHGLGPIGRTGHSVHFGDVPDLARPDDLAGSLMAFV